MLPLRLLFVLLPLLLAAPAWAATCTLTSDVVLSDTGQTGTMDCGAWTAADTLVTGAFKLSVDSANPDLTQNGAAIGLTVSSGGEFEARVTDNAIIVTFGQGASGSSIFALGGSTWDIAPGFRQWGVASPTTQSTEQFGYVGVWVPCPVVDATPAPDILEPDCAGTGDANTVRSWYRQDTYDVADGTALDPHLDETLAEWVAGEDVMWSLDGDQTDATTPMDDGWPYQITAVDATAGDTGGPGLSFTVDIRQCSTNCKSNGYPLADRAVSETTLEADVLKGQSTVTVGSGFIAATGQRAGQMLYFTANGETCGDADATPCLTTPYGFRIHWTVDGGAGTDTIYLATPATCGNPDANNVCYPTACDGGTCDAWIMPPAFENDQPIMVMVPVIFRSASAAERDTLFDLRGTVSLYGAVFDETGSIKLGSTDLNPTKVRLNWLRDVQAALGLSVSFRYSDYGGDAPIDLVRVTGSQTDEDESAFTIETPPAEVTGKIGWNDIGCRFQSGSCFPLNNPTSFSGTVRRARSQFIDQTSTGTFGLTGNISTIEVVDAECIACTDASQVINAPVSGGANNVRGLSIIGINGSVTTIDGVHFYDLTVVGGVIASTATMLILAERVEGCVLRGLDLDGTNTYVTLTLSGGASIWKRCIVVDSDIGRGFGWGQPLDITDNVYWDLTSDRASGLTGLHVIAAGATVTGTVARNLFGTSAGYTIPTNKIVRALDYTTAAALSSFNLGPNTFIKWRNEQPNAQALGLGNLSAQATWAKHYWFDNYQDFNPGATPDVADSIPTGSSRAVPIRVRDAARGDFRLVAGDPGANDQPSSPGIQGNIWSRRINRLGVENGKGGLSGGGGTLTPRAGPSGTPR